MENEGGMTVQSLDEIWAAIQEVLTAKCSSKSIYELWFKDLKLSYLDAEHAVVTINSDLKANIIKQRYLGMIIEAVCEVMGFDVSVDVLSSEHGEPAIDATMFKDAGKDPAGEALHVDLPDADRLGTPIPYNNEYTFENFIVGSSNKMAVAAATAVARRTGSQYNPLFIYGNSGLGKTHLLYAIINEMKQNYKDLTIVYVKGDDFTNELISAIASQTTTAFRNKYRKADVLLIDDIQFIAGKESTQEEFFHTFNALYEDHKQIILAADCPPRDMKTLEDRLRGRFEWGLIVDVTQPDYELRLAIIKDKAKKIGVNIPLPVMKYLAENLRSNIRQLEGAVKKISAQSFLSGEEVTEEMAKNCIVELTNGGEPVSATIERILTKVAENYGLSSSDLKSRRQTKDVAYARHIAIYIVREILSLSQPAIGKIFNRDPSTINASLQVIEKEKQRSPLLDVEIRDLMREIREG